MSMLFKGKCIWAVFWWIFFNTFFYFLEVSSFYVRHINLLWRFTSGEHFELPVPSRSLGFASQTWLIGTVCSLISNLYWNVNQRNREHGIWFKELKQDTHRYTLTIVFVIFWVAGTTISNRNNLFWLTVLIRFSPSAQGRHGGTPQFTEVGSVKSVWVLLWM